MVRPFVCLYWGHKFENILCRQGVSCSEQYQEFWRFSRDSQLPQFHPTNTPTFQFLYSLHAISYSHSFIRFMIYFTSFTDRKSLVWRTSVGLWTVCGAKRGANHVLIHWALRLSEYRLGENGPSVGLILARSPGVVQVAAVSR